MVPPAAIYLPEPNGEALFPETLIPKFILPDPLTIHGVAKRRAAFGKLVAREAAAADCDAFKGRTSHLHKPLAKRWDHRLSIETLSRGGSSLKQAAAYLKTPGLISLGGGLPSSEYFPFEQLDIKVPRIGRFSEQETRISGDVIHCGKYDMIEDKSLFDISVACNYGLGHGAAQLLRWIIEHTEIVHNPPYQDWNCTMSVGSTCSWDYALRMFTEPGDWIISEQYSYPAAIESAIPLRVRCAAVEMDNDGMIPSSLDEMLTNWDVAIRGARKPFLLYTVPTGQNPTGTTQSLGRRRAIYAVAQKHDLYIFEDEPYYFLQMQPYASPEERRRQPLQSQPATHAEYLKSLVPSYLSLDVDGRVMRADSFSKVLAPGSRLSWITASEQICERFRNHADVCTQGPSGFSQLILFKLLDEQWGHAGYLDWLMHMGREYSHRRDVMMDACGRHLPREIVRWQPPMAGMFHWIEVDWKRHPNYPHRSLAEIEEDIFQRVVAHGTLVMKGSWFCAEKSFPTDTMFFRTTYAATRLGQIDEAIRRLGFALRDAFGLPLPTVHQQQPSQLYEI